jgi:GNAT superfamily N-acetyltransferase
METRWLPQLRPRYPRPFPPEIIKSKFEEQILFLLHRPLLSPDPEVLPWIADYPAHLHINLLPAAQGHGWGRTLMDTLLGDLARRKVPGIHLGVGASNTGAIAFYKKMGFTPLREEAWGFTMGKRV